MASPEPAKARDGAARSSPLLPTASFVALAVLIAVLSVSVTTLLQLAMRGDALNAGAQLVSWLSGLEGEMGGAAETSMTAGSHDTVWWTNKESFLRGYTCRGGYSLKVLSRDPLIMFVENFLQPGEGDYLRNISSPRMQRSSVAESADNYYAESQVRTSSSAFLDKDEDAVVSCVERRAAALSGIPIADCEPLQVVWYTKGQKYNPHLDYFPRKDLKDYWSQRSGQRYVTILAYINDDIQGGGTEFPKLGLVVKPKRDAAVFWHNVNLQEVEDHRTLHGGMVVESGEKWAINIWQRKKIPGWDSGVSAPGADNHAY